VERSRDGGIGDWWYWWLRVVVVEVVVGGVEWSGREKKTLVCVGR
jgi:hypothetical protein